MTQQKQLEYAIIGGGIAGLSLAIALLKRGVRLTIYEQAPRFGEIGAGVSFSPNAIRAMKECDASIYEGFRKVATHNAWESKRNHFFDYVDGYHAVEKHLFTLASDEGANSVHRAAFLDELVKVIPDELCRFGKHLDNVAEASDGRMEMKFHDGSTAYADAIIGCDGIKSRVRQLILGEDSPSSYPHYSYKYAYRGLIPRDVAIKALGEDHAVNSFIYMGPQGHVLTFPVNHGELMNVVAFRDNKTKEWPDSHKLTLPSTKQQAQDEFKGWGASVTKIIELLRDDLDCWAMFDTFDHPARTFVAGRMAVLGDAAHATTPHHGAGAGMCIEDAAVMAHLLADPAVEAAGRAGAAAAFATFDQCRRERGQFLVRSSRQVGNLYEWMATREDGSTIGDNIPEVERELKARHDKIWNVDLSAMQADARAVLSKKLST